MKRVNVLLPTYNGEKFLREQLDCLLAQTYRNLDIYVRDDGSSDKTMDIVREYANRNVDGFRFHIVAQDGRNLGYPDCFWELLKVSEPADYYSFCDQDDIWFPEKIEKAVERIEKEEQASGVSTPIMCFCDFDYCNERMEFSRSNAKYADMEHPKFYEGMYYTYSPGFTQVINKALVDALQLEQLFGMHLAHDLWCQWVASGCGKVLFDNHIRAHYRRHGAAVTAANVSRWESLKLWWKKEVNGDQIRNWKKSLCYFSKLFYDEVSMDAQKALGLFGDEKVSIGKRIRKVFYGKRLRPTRGGDMALRLLIILGKC